MIKYFYLGIALVLMNRAAIAQPLDSSVHTVLFLGNSITYAGEYITDIEACYTIFHRRQLVNFINLGLPSETVSGLSETGHANGKFPRPDLHERLHRILAALKPDWIVACYGMNDGIYLPFDSSRFQKYKDGINWLHDTLVLTGARVIMLTPPVYDEKRGSDSGYANVLDRYASWLLKKRKSGWEVTDIHFPMKKYLAAHRKLDAAFGIDAFALTSDGVHPGEAGHWLMAKQLLLYFGEKKAAAYSSVKAAMAVHAHGTEVLKLLTEQQNFMKDAWLTAIGHLRPGMKAGLSLQEAKTKAALISKQIDVLLE